MAVVVDHTLSVQEALHVEQMTGNVNATNSMAAGMEDTTH
jgi:hypothetical protein